MATVYGFGTAAVDFRIRTADFGDLYKDKLLAQTCAEMGGGALANFLSQVSRLGGRTAFLGKLGRDPMGEKIVS
ncbi:MAG: carbohydrate kinase, partial [Clostridia bacterium]|nr:carbohydrate kinase [Clostridia bacterium]